MFVYHIVLPEEWEKFTAQPLYTAPSLESEGFIHCSFADQIDAVLDRYYSNAHQVVVLKIDTEKLTSRLVSEPSTGGETYPHIYGPINSDAVVGSEQIVREKSAS